MERLRDPRGAVRLLLLASLVGLALGEVGDFSPCLRFFHRDVPPTGLPASRHLTPVCQRFRNQYRFASLYDRQRRTPLYSAYLLTPAAGKRPKNHWKYEPQVRAECVFMRVCVCVCVCGCVGVCVCVCVCESGLISVVFEGKQHVCLPLTVILKHEAVITR